MSERVSTRSSNAEKHPGLAHLALNRRSADEIALEKAQKRATQEAADKKKKKSQERLADAESKLADQQKARTERAPRAPVRPARSQRVPDIPQDVGEGPGADESEAARPPEKAKSRKRSVKGGKVAKGAGDAGGTEPLVHAAKPKQTVAVRSTFRSGVEVLKAGGTDSREVPAVPHEVNTGNGNGDARVVRPVSFKAVVKKWSSNVPRSAPPSVVSSLSRSTTQKVASAASSVAGVRPANASGASAIGDHIDSLGISDDDDENITRERLSLNQTSARDDNILDIAHAPSDLLEMEEMAEAPSKKTSNKRVHSDIEEDHSNDEREVLPPSDEEQEDLSSSPPYMPEAQLSDQVEQERLMDKYLAAMAPPLTESDKLISRHAAQDQPDPKPLSRTTSSTDVAITENPRAPKRAKAAPATKSQEKVGKPSALATATPIPAPAPTSASASAPTSSKAKKLPSKWVKEDLPSYCNNKSLWTFVYIPTFLAWLGTQRAVWGPSSASILDAMKDIWLAVYEQEMPEEQDTVEGAAFGLKANDWRANFGSTAIAVLLNNFVEQEMHGQDTSEKDRRWYAEGLLCESAFMHEEVTDDGTPVNPLRGKFMGNIIATHYSATQGYIEVPDVSELTGLYAPWGAITLAITAGERACTLAKEGKLGSIEHILHDLASFEASGRRGSIINRAKTLMTANKDDRLEANGRTGKQSTTILNFSEQNWSAASSAYWLSVRAAEPKVMASALEASAVYSNKVKRGEREADNEGDTDVPAAIAEDRRAKLTFCR
ncbi:hypothetical protein CONPUDRAFT_158104 [Coniophora puteana RWD-64-598 SS2]|uniref:Uncharacterized protein n=1 Tax=Coniophora puteana (strain RWD-64-598) TaxID=741705 RepID=A0A5M3MD06_CONPW|nr:uncharacterized protein CONPUDRAFT_158104 [Coniophora puteana RWD-64-598 SS2]EIW76963.1 hypothetical protein CONPUDRAFT_158104 [Coniophora puteana RWD-64-598 SS2]